MSPKAIAVQSPYVAQVQLLRDSLDEIPLARGVEIATIDSFQGREADAVIISMVCFNEMMTTHVLVTLIMLTFFCMILKTFIEFFFLNSRVFYRSQQSWLTKIESGP